MRKKICFWILFIIAIHGFALSPAERWALALTEIMTVANNSSHETLNFTELNESNKKIWIGILKRDWGINNRDELLSTIESMEINGHAVTLEKIKGIILYTKDYSFFNMISEYKLTAKEYNYLKFTLANWNIFKNRNIDVWDYGRNISLCRWGYDCGYLTEKEAWDKIMYYAKKIQPMYTSWNEYGFDYYMGRVFWASGFSAEIDYAVKTDAIYHQLISDQGYWSTLNWDENLEQ